MDASGTDRPLALVGGRRTLLTEAVVLDLLRRGYDVHLPDALVPDALASRDARRVFPVAGGAGATGDDEALLASALATRRPLALTVVTDPTAHLAAAVRVVAAAGVGTRVLEVHASPVLRGRGVVTVLSPATWVRHVPPRLALNLVLRPHELPDDAAAAARRGIDAALSGRGHATYGVPRRAG